MSFSFIQCTAIVSAVSLMASAQPSSAYQTFDSNLEQESKESSSLLKTKAIEKALNKAFLPSFANYNSKLKDSEQEKILNKISSINNTNIGVISKDDFDLLCYLVAAEAENQPYEGKRAVVAVVLNRIDYGAPFEDSIEDVIFQENQFSCIGDGRFFDAWEYVSEDDIHAVIDELLNRSDYEILYFTAYDYGEYGTPAYQIGDHYFCTE